MENCPSCGQSLRCPSCKNVPEYPFCTNQFHKTARTPNPEGDKLQAELKRVEGLIGGNPFS